MSGQHDQIRVRHILEHAHEHPWRIQDIGLLALRLDDRREHRLHVWDPTGSGLRGSGSGAVGDPPIHDHPYDFTSTVIVGELVNTRYVEDPSGSEYARERYALGYEEERRDDTVRLVGTSETLRAGARYHQLAHELHGSRPVPGTVTVLEFQPVSPDPPELTVCRRPGTPWLSGQARVATWAEIERITAAALAQLDA